jgi:two-component system NarL family sensor kinase
MRKQRRPFGFGKWLYILWFVVLLHTGFVLPVCGQQAENEGRYLSTGPQLLPDTASINKVLSRARALLEQQSDSADLLYYQTLASSRQQRYNHGIARSLFGLSRGYSNKNNYEKALEYARQALLYCTDDEKGHEVISAVYLALSETYYFKGRYDSCAYYRYAALADLENDKLQNPRLQLQVYCRILQFWLNVHDDIRNDPYIQEVMQRINRIERTALAANDSSLLLNIYFYKSGYYNNIRQNDSARYYCQRHLELGKLLKAPISMTIATLLNTGLIYLDDKETRLARQYFQRAIAEIPEQDKASNRYYIFANIFQGEAYVQEGAWEKAIAVTLPALQKAQSLKIVSITDHAHKSLAEAYEALGQYKAAAEHRKQYSILRDSLLRVQKLEIMYDMEMKYRISDKDKQLAQKELAIARNESRIKSKNFWISGITTGFILICLITLLLYRNNRHKQRLQTEKIRNLRQEIQITSLQAMITGEEKERSRIARELHDGMGGTLSAIRTRVSAIFRKHRTTNVDDDFEDVMKMLEEASADLRKTAHNLMPEILLQEGLARASQLFCERLHKGHSLQIHTEIWGTVRRLPGDTELTAYRIIQELLHNTLKHAGATQALVQIVFHDSQLCITVEDNGHGMPESTWKKADGMGLKTIRERVQLMNGQMDIASSPEQGTSIYIELGIVPTKQNTIET